MLGIHEGMNVNAHSSHVRHFSGGIMVLLQCKQLRRTFSLGSDNSLEFF